MSNFGSINSLFAPQQGVSRPPAMGGQGMQTGFVGQPTPAGRGYAPPIDPMSQDFIRGFMAGAQAFARTARQNESQPYKFGSNQDYGKDYDQDYSKDYGKDCEQAYGKKQARPNTMIEQFADLVKSLLGVDKPGRGENVNKPRNTDLRPDPSYWPDRKENPDYGILPIVGNNDPKMVEELFLLVLMMQQNTENTGIPQYN